MTDIKVSQNSRCVSTPSKTTTLMTQVLRLKKTVNQNQILIKQVTKTLISVCSQLSHFVPSLAEKKE